MHWMKRGLSVASLLLGACLIVVDPIIARLFLPFREMIGVLLSVQLVVCFLIFWRHRQGGRSLIWPFAIAAVTLVFGMAVLPAEYRTREETVAFTSKDTRLVGTLYHSKAEGEHPALVIVHGSGKFPRRLYRYWGQTFAALGFDVLVYDKRGVGDSGGQYEGENNTSPNNLDVLAEDASNAVTFIASQPGVTRHIGLFGVSQGGWIAPMAAARNARVKFLILHSGPVVSVREQNYFAKLTGEGHDSPKEPITDAEAHLRAIRPGGFDPRPVLADLNATALWLFGDADSSVPVGESVTHLQPLITSGKAFEYRLFHGDHLILTRSTRFSGLNEQYWNTIVDWMMRHKGRDLEEHAKL